MLGEAHPATAGSVLGLGQVAYEQGDYAEAESALRRAVAAYEKRPGTARSLDLALRSLAEVRAAQGQTAEAFRLQLRSLEIQQQELRQIFRSATEAAMYDYVASIAGSIETLVALARLRQMRNPLLRSGIVLAGANATAESAGATPVDDGYVTAEEITLLNLRGTELVVLSACETGLGDVRVGEGVYGLRHAFLYAGARTLVTSLFEVPDAETRAMMKRFYEALDAGRDKLEALHEAQLAIIRQRRQAHDAAHPFFWASFVLVGDAR